jgi:hypothetical protein
MRARPALVLAYALLLLPGGASSQHFSSARGAALGAWTGVASDPGALDWNPAGLTGVRDWELSAANFYGFGGAARSVTFQSAAIARRFLPGHTAAVRFSPGISAEFVVPSTFTVEDSGSSIMTQFDKEISYSERLAIGYAFRAGDRFSLGVAAHFLEEKVTDTKYSIDTNNVVSASPAEYRGNSWSVDWGALWEPRPDLKVGAVAKNLFRITESSLPGEAASPPLDLSKTLRAGASYAGFGEVLVSADADLDKRFRAGAEWAAAPFLRAAAGVCLEGDGGFSAEALSAGLSGSAGNVEMALGLLFFLDQTDRGGSAELSRFLSSGIDAIEYNAFTGDRASFSVSVSLGRTRDPIARIEYVEMLSDIYPSSSPVYAFRPVGRARVRNVSDSPIEATVRFSMTPFMDSPTESRPQAILPGETAEIPFFAVLNSAVQGVRTMTVSEGEVSVSAVTTGEREDSYPARVLVRGKNDWNGDVTLLRYFVTPGDPQILAVTRSVLNEGADAADSADARLRDFGRARMLFDALSGGLLYVNDPRSSQDRVQYPSETLGLKGGDCDDFTVLYCSMLSSIGIRTAFVDVVPPGSPDSAHVYMMFDTGIAGEDAGLLGDNPKRYILRGRQDGGATLWIPIETTLTKKGFDAAWEYGANQYYRDVEVGYGLVRGWVRVVDQETDY